MIVVSGGYKSRNRGKKTHTGINTAYHSCRICFHDEVVNAVIGSGPSHSPSK